MSSQDDDNRANGAGTRARLFIVEFDLGNLSSHFFNQVLGFKLAAEELGLLPCVFLPKNVDASLAIPLAGHAVIDFAPLVARPPDRELDGFADGDRGLRSLWAAMEAMAVSSRDIVLISSGRPGVIYSLGAWLGRLEREKRPAVFLRFYDYDFLHPETERSGGRDRMLRFAAQDLALRPGQDRVFFTVNNGKAVMPLARLCGRRVFQFPLPKYYGETPDAGEARAHAPVIYVHLNARCGVMLDKIQSVVGTILDKQPQVKFLLKYCGHARSPDPHGGLNASLVERGVELVPTELSYSKYLATIARSDIVLLPYDVTEYATLVSGVFAEGAAFGKVIVYPGNSWMAEQVAAGRAAGVGFARTNEQDIGAAVLRALASLPQLSKAAREQAPAFRKEHSCRSNLELMLGLAPGHHDMGVTCSLGTAVSFGHDAQSLSYMGRGWSRAESQGIWTDGPTAELAFRIEPKPARALSVRVRLTPFVVNGHRQTVAVSVNGTELCEWSFVDRDERRAVWRDFTIPAQVVAGDEIKLLLRVKNPLAPRQAGMSGDARALGVMFHEMVVDDAPGEEIPSVKPLQ